MFPTRSTDGYIVLDSIPVPSLSSLTVTMWVKCDSCSSIHVPLTYSTRDFEKELMLKLEESSSLCKWSFTMKDVEYVCFFVAINHFTYNGTMGLTRGVPARL